MHKIYTFEEFLNEAQRSEPHFTDREVERLQEASAIKLSPEAMKAIADSGMAFPDFEKQALALIKKEVRDKIIAMLRVDFPPTVSYLLSVKKFEYEFGDKTVPLNIVAFSMGKGDKINKHVGNQYWIPCYRNTFYTLLLFPDGVTEEELRDKSSDNLRRNFGVAQKTTVSRDEDFVTRLGVEGGKVVKMKEKREGISKTVDISGQWLLSPGREFKFFMPAKNDFVRAEIVKVDNDPAYKSDRFFRIEVLVHLGDKKAKMLKKISPGDKLVIPVKSEMGEVDVPVTVHDSLYVVDKRAANPILKFL
jgi:hypothetical protein